MANAMTLLRNWAVGFIDWLDARCGSGTALTKKRDQREHDKHEKHYQRNGIAEVYPTDPRELRITVALNGRQCEEADLSDNEAGKSPHQQRECATTTETINPNGQQKADNLQDKAYVEQPTGNRMRRS